MAAEAEAAEEGVGAEGEVECEAVVGCLARCFLPRRHGGGGGGDGGGDGGGCKALGGGQATGNAATSSRPTAGKAPSAQLSFIHRSTTHHCLPPPATRSLPPSTSRRSTPTAAAPAAPAAL